ncbi:PREDICTED: putative F-box protein At4g05475 [Camelina sativa]|uniref:F-box protein At4g05475 n=1 Tax=Camelina sativa TaxID=90675 RepID=A0ABM0T8E0_CAMSA|nr:PREDICTED: putative F-box protein At4g05475 [Camelina sativa]
MSAPSSTLVPPLMMKDEEESRNWAELPSDLTSSILLRLGAVEILENAQKVCTSWRRICKDRTMWQKIDMRDLGNRRVGDLDFEILCRHAVDLSQGGLLEIHLDVFATNELISYIAERSRNLISLGLHQRMTNEGLVNAIAKFPFLETLEVSHSALRLDSKAIGRACPHLKTLKLNSSGWSGYISFRTVCDDDDYPLAIAESMQVFRHQPCRHS